MDIDPQLMKIQLNILIFKYHNKNISTTLIIPNGLPDSEGKVT